MPTLLGTENVTIEILRESHIQELFLKRRIR